MVSVLLPAYNAQNTIAETIQSIIEQTYKEWELIIINDGSTDNTKYIIQSFKDPRIRYFENDGNKKLIYTLNKGIDLSKGDYIARIDADDIAMPERLEQQVAFMDSQKDVIVCGSFMQAFGQGIDSYVISYFTDDQSIKEHFLISSPFGHPSVMIRKQALIVNNIRYDADYLHAEDLKLWYDLMDYGKYANIPTVLMKYRISDTQCTQKGNATMISNSQLCRRLYLREKVSGEIWERLATEGVTARLIRYSKRRLSNKTLIRALYQSMDKFCLSVFLYYFVSGDFISDSFSEMKNTVNRFLGRSIPWL